MSEILQTIQSWGTPAIVILLLIKELRSGSKQVTAEVMAGYKALDDQQKEALVKKEADLAETKSALRAAEKSCAEQVSKLKGSNEEKQATIERLNKIVENKNPELLNILQQNVEINAKVSDFMQRLLERQEKSDQELAEQTNMLRAGAKRNKEIDEHTAAQVGKPLKK